MAKIKQDITLPFRTTKDGETEDTHFKAGDDVRLVQEWERFYLIKDNNGHLYNIPKDKLEP